MQALRPCSHGRRSRRRSARCCRAADARHGCRRSVRWPRHDSAMTTSIEGRRHVTKQFTVRAVAAGLLALLSLAGAQAQDDYPNRPITLLVGLSAGGITDISARLYAEQVSKTIGKRIVVENRPGGGGAVAAGAVQTAPPDGYTLIVFSGSQHAAVPAVQSAPYDPVKGFAPITLLFDLAAFVTVPVDFPANTIQEMLEQGRKKPGGLLFGSPGVGTPSHLLAAKIASATNTPVQH